MVSGTFFTEILDSGDLPEGGDRNPWFSFKHIKADYNPGGKINTSKLTLHLIPGSLEPTQGHLLKTHSIEN